MNTLRKSGLILSLTIAFSLPIGASADEAAAPAAAAAEQPALEVIHPMQEMMREMRRDRDPSKCKTSSTPDAATPMPGMGMGMGMMGMGMGMGAGDGAMQGDKCKTGAMHGEGKPCMSGQRKHCEMHGGGDDRRLDMLEKRMDMMQMMMQMMMRSGGGN